MPAPIQGGGASFPSCASVNRVFRLERPGSSEVHFWGKFGQSTMQKSPAKFRKVSQSRIKSLLNEILPREADRLKLRPNWCRRQFIRPNQTRSKQL
jgi:hypothetical protein